MWNPLQYCIIVFHFNDGSDVYLQLPGFINSPQLQVEADHVNVADADVAHVVTKYKNSRK